MAEQYTIRSVKKRDERQTAYGTFQDYALILEGVGEPVKMSLSYPVAKDPEVGGTLYGTLNQVRTNDGKKTYYEFKPEKRKVNTDERIKSLSAIDKAVTIWVAQGCDPAAYDNIKAEAIHFYNMVDEVVEEANS